MRSKNTPVLGLAAALGLAVGFLASPACGAPKPQDDTIQVRKDTGGSETYDGVEVTAANFEKVAFTVKGRSREVPAGDVLKIKWGDAPPDYAVGMGALRAGQGEKARKAFQNCLDAKVAEDLRGWVEEFGHLGMADAYSLLALTDAAQIDKAIRHYNGAKTANPRSFGLDRILAGLAAAELTKGNPSGALRAAGELVTAGRTSRRAAWEIKGQTLTAGIQLGEGKHTEAARAYDAVVRLVDSALAAVKDPIEKRRLERERIRAAASQGWVLLDKAAKSKSSGDIDKARSHFNGLPGKYGRKPEVLAAKGNAAGVIKLIGGDAEGARREFVHTEVSYFMVAEEVARSLYYQAECLEQLGRSQERTARIRDLKEYYPRSEWARKLKK